jgi:hypothetical protein
MQHSYWDAVKVRFRGRGDAKWGIPPLSHDGAPGKTSYTEQQLAKACEHDITLRIKKWQAEVAKGSRSCELCFRI